MLGQGRGMGQFVNLTLRSFHEFSAAKFHSALTEQAISLGVKRAFFLNSPPTLNGLLKKILLNRVSY